MMAISLKNSDLPKGVYIRESHKETKIKIVMSGSIDVLFVVYIRTNHLKKSSFLFFKNSPTCPK